MADFEKLEHSVHSIVAGLENAVAECLTQKKSVVEDLIGEQLYSGLDGDTNSLRPSYSDDPFFDIKGRWYHDSDGYIEWKKNITPPIASPRLNLPPRPIDVPNLYITGTFHESIRATVNGGKVLINTVGFSDGPDIVRKYGDNILNLGMDAREYIVLEMLKPFVGNFFKKYGF
ncbi:hypothetical protein [Bacteroides sp. ET336]|uniref:hypothetical protein n=1 Tax=Bacteroides sp. ET336 TaxID=2972459 RepID=UPI0021ABCEBA|nr:hypothetical protein [Bacteroides sp. ET336]MCR8892443.1 hypothetical protein [Bacteroides sp. ET336]MDN0056939.1 hypothetical protein [Bacteroides caecigallinarum]